MKKPPKFWRLLHCKRGFFAFQLRCRNLFSLNLNLDTVHIKPVLKIGNFTVFVKYYQSIPFIRNLFTSFLMRGFPCAIDPYGIGIIQIRVIGTCVKPCAIIPWQTNTFLKSNIIEIIMIKR